MFSCPKLNFIQKCIDYFVHKNSKADALKARLTEAVEVRGNDPEKRKEEVLRGFSEGTIKQLITKPSVAGFGMNWQHCNHQVFAGLSYSFESYYQAVRRCWRFGQSREVTVDIIVADTESAIESAIATKQNDHRLMQSEMASAMRSPMRGQVGLSEGKAIYQPKSDFKLPSFLGE